MKQIIVIPARMKGTRLPGKPLIKILNKTIIWRVWNQCQQVHPADKIFVATEDIEIKNHCDDLGINCVITGKANTAIDRIKLFSDNIKADAYINVQGDEPLINPEDILSILKYNQKHPNRVIFGKSQGITFSSFLNQYIFYPQTIGSERLINLDLTFKNILQSFILIYLAIIPLFYQNLKKIFINRNYIKHNNFFIFLALLCLTLSLILHQMLTKNQIFIFFLIPILAAFSQISLNEKKLKFKKQIYLLIVLFCLFATFKYHLRYNEGRKFHEMDNVNFKLTEDAKKIDKKLLGLNWITPKYKNKPEEEIYLINQTLLILKKDLRKKMVITNYPFLSIVLEQKLYSPSRVYTGDGTTHPLRGSKYVTNYKKLMDNLILKNNISVIYVIDTYYENTNFHYVDLYQDCSKEIVLLKHLKSYELKNCIQINK